MCRDAQWYGSSGLSEILVGINLIYMSKVGISSWVEYTQLCPVFVLIK